MRSSAGRIVAQLAAPASVTERVATPASSCAASERSSTPGAERKIAGPISGLSSHWHASRSAIAKVRSTPRVFWNASSWVQFS